MCFEHFFLVQHRKKASNNYIESFIRAVSVEFYNKTVQQIWQQKKNLSFLCFFSCACTCPWKVACHSNELRPYVINNAFLCRGHTGHLHHYACAPSGFLTYPFGVLEYWPWGKMNRLFPFDYKSQTLVFWVRGFYSRSADLKSFAADTKKAQTTSGCKIFFSESLKISNCFRAFSMAEMNIIKGRIFYIFITS